MSSFNAKQFLSLLQGPPPKRIIEDGTAINIRRSNGCTFVRVMRLKVRKGSHPKPVKRNAAKRSPAQRRNRSK